MTPRWSDDDPADAPTPPAAGASAGAAPRPAGSVAEVDLGDTQPIEIIDLRDPRPAPVVIDLPLDDEPGSVPEPALELEPETDPEPEPDPRFEERRRIVRAGRRRRLRRRLGAFAGLVLVGMAGVAAVYSPLLDVDHVEIVGTEQLTAEQLARLTGVGVGSPLLLVDTGAVEDRLRDDPRFVRVVVQRRFPGDLSVRLTDRRALARVAGPTRGAVVGEGGVVIARARGDELLRTIDVTTDPPVRPGSVLPRRLADAVDVSGSMSFELAVRITHMRITEDGELVFELADGATVLFGTVADAERKLLAMTTMLGPQVDPSGVCQLDIRVPTAPTMRRRPACDPPAPPAPVVPDPAATAASTAPPPDASTAPPPDASPASPPDAGAAPPADPAVAADAAATTIAPLDG